MNCARITCLLLAVAALPLVAGCLFDTREPEPPDTAAIDYLPRSGPANVWENCRLALTNRDSGGWDTAVSENFEYVPDGNTETGFGGVDWMAWTKETEMAFIGSWFASGAQITSSSLQWIDTDISTPDGSGGYAEWDLIYYFEVESNSSVTRYRGRAILQFELEGSYWYLRYWRDEQGEDDPDSPGSTLATMGTLRGTFGN